MNAQMQAPSALGRVVELVRDLRKRCPWDAAQTRETLRPYLVEEVLELDQSIATGNVAEIKDELGDLMLHLAFQIVIGEEGGAFGAEDVTGAIEAKMWRRHPHLFPDLTPGVGAPPPPPGPSPGSWERQKNRERPSHRPGVLDGLPPSLPALIMAHRLQERAAGVGFDWPDDRGPREKIREELNELEAELGTPRDPGRIEHEIGDLLFAVVNLARKTGCDARAALEKANARFLERFGKIEALAVERGIEIGSAGLETLDELWEEAKKGDR
jgi:ATP diphosphatase